MNRANLKVSIDQLYRVKEAGGALAMEFWVNWPLWRLLRINPENFEQSIKMGLLCCVGGFTALSEEARRQGMIFEADKDKKLYVKYDGKIGLMAMQAFWRHDYFETMNIILPVINNPLFFNIYPRKDRMPTLDETIAVLKFLYDKGTIAALITQAQFEQKEYIRNAA